MAPIRGAARCAAAAVAAGCLLGSLVAAADCRADARALGDQGITLLQTASTQVSRRELEEELQESRARWAELAAEVAALRRRLAEAEDKCGDGRGGLGLCAVFGDPHFATFDGAHTIMLHEQTSWLVQSERVWVQALSEEENHGNLMGLAISGPFMQGHTLIFANTSSVSGSAKPFTVLFDDEPILDSWGPGGSAEFSQPKIMWAARREEWNFFLHERSILSMEEVVSFDVGTWASRFTGKPKGGVYLFKLPEGVELTVTGADLMSAGLLMAPQKGGQAGYCGNFNGDASDEFQAPPPGSVPENLRAAWNIPVGEGLLPVPEELNLFRMSRALGELVAAPPPPRPLATSAPGGAVAIALARPCPAELLGKADEACGKVKDPALHAACLIDVCESGDPAVADAALAVGILKAEA